MRKRSLDWLDETTENDFYVAKRKAAAVLGHRLRPGDLPPTDRGPRAARGPLAVSFRHGG